MLGIMDATNWKIARTSVIPTFGTKFRGAMRRLALGKSELRMNPLTQFKKANVRARRSSMTPASSVQTAKHLSGNVENSRGVKSTR